MNEPMVTSRRIDLNMDVLLAIIFFSPLKTATSIMTTCRFLYHEGAKVILRRPICLYGSNHDLPTLRFIQAEDLSRCAYVRHLSILANGYSGSEAVARILVEIIPRMSALEYLRLRGDLLFRAFPYLLSIFASLRSVKTLIVEEAGEKSLELVRTLQSELVSAKILFPSTVYGTRSFPAFNHPIPLLRRSASTLQDVEYGFWQDTHTNVHAVMSFPQMIYPNVHTLVLRTSGDDVPCLPPYIRAFPNLIHLRVEEDCSLPEEIDFSWLRLHQSQQDQINIPLSLIEEPLVWKRLQTYTGTLPTLRALRITFPIPRLYFKPPTHDWSSAQFELTEVFAYARPVHLTIAFEKHPFSQSLKADLLPALRSDSGSNLQSLSLTIDLMAADVDDNFDVDEFGTTIEHTFSRLQLCSLEIVVQDISLPKTASTAPLPSPEMESDHTVHTHDHVDATTNHSAHSAQPEGTPWLFPYSEAEAEHRAWFTLAERTLEDFDVCAFVDRLTTSLPTLKHVEVSIARPSRWGGGIMRTAWLGIHDVLSEKQVNTVENVIFYEEYRVEVKKQRWGESLARICHEWYTAREPARS